MTAGEPTLNYGVSVARPGRGLVTITEENVEPLPVVWPVCDTCDTPYVLRLCHLFGTGKITRRWAWMKDCAKPRSTCKAAKAALHDAKGEVPACGR